METRLISDGCLSARITPFGATLTDLRLDGWPHPLILGFERLEDYRDTDHFAGAVIGRHANRIAFGRAEINGQLLRLPRNGGEHHLHGGTTGLARQVWRITEKTSASLAMQFESPDGHEGYPGNCTLLVRYTVLPPATLRLDFEAVTDADTLVNLCHHPYFDFSGAGDLAGHRLRIAAESYLPSGPDLIPTGEIAPVAGTPFDFRQLRAIGGTRPRPGFNNTYCLATTVRDDPALAARLSLPDGPQMKLWTTQTGLHLYDGYKLRDGLRGLEGRRYGPGGGLCLEAQNWPDSPNHPNFPSAVLRPGETYRQRTEYRFRPLDR
jgi:aldose 1-epimerase